MKLFETKTLQAIARLRFIDDTFFRVVSARKEVCQEILRILLDEPNLNVLSVTPQADITSLQREIILDVLCLLTTGRIANIEVQKGRKTNDVRRCRFHLSSVTANKTPKGTDFRDVPDVIILYITDYDALGNQQTITRTQMCAYQNGSYLPINDGGTVYYANTLINDDTDKAELLALFNRDDIFHSTKFPELSKAVSYFKENAKGREEMSSVMEDYTKEITIISSITSYDEVGLTKEDILPRIIRRFNLTKEDAENYYNETFTHAENQIQ